MKLLITNAKCQIQESICEMIYIIRNMTKIRNLAFVIWH